MIIDLPNTRTREISAKIDELHEERGESATGRVLTLLIRTDDASVHDRDVRRLFDHGGEHGAPHGQACP